MHIRYMVWKEGIKRTVGKRVNLCVLILIAVDATEARESILAVDVHCARTTNTLST